MDAGDKRTGRSSCRSPPLPSWFQAIVLCQAKNGAPEGIERQIHRGERQFTETAARRYRLVRHLAKVDIRWRDGTYPGYIQDPFGHVIEKSGKVSRTLAHQLCASLVPELHSTLRIYEPRWTILIRRLRQSLGSLRAFMKRPCPDRRTISVSSQKRPQLIAFLPL
jgi:hypothetical protein